MKSCRGLMSEIPRRDPVPVGIQKRQGQFDPVFASL